MLNTTVYCLTHGPRWQFLRDFLEAFEQNALMETRLVIGVQEPHESMQVWLRTQEVTKSLPENTIIKVYADNTGLNRYPQLIEEFGEDDQLAIDTDDDSLFPRGAELLFERVLKDERFGWVGLNPIGSPILKRPNGNKWDIDGLTIIEAAVGGGLAATRKDVYDKVGGFGIGRTIFDPEDARYQRICVAMGYRCGIIEGKTYEHRGGWNWHIKYGTALSRMDSLHAALVAGFISEETYRAMLMEYKAALEVYNG